MVIFYSFVKLPEVIWHNDLAVAVSGRHFSMSRQSSEESQDRTDGTGQWDVSPTINLPFGEWDDS